MNESGYPYRETLLQWIWQELEFDTSSLKTSTGDTLEIVDPGKINTGAGPDFTNACVRIKGLKLHGSVEIHTYPDAWVHHRHEESDRFDSVVLHVVYDIGRPDHTLVLRPDGTTPPLLILRPYLQKSLARLFERKQLSGLPCENSVQFINQNAFERQIEKAHRDYFDYKTSFLLERYDGGLALSKAWQVMLGRGIFHTLGLPKNRDAMERMFECIRGISPEGAPEAFISRAATIGFNGPASKQIHWVHTGMRPASRPEKRAEQAAAFWHAINHLPFKAHLSYTEDAWPRLLQAIPATKRPGAQMESILKHTIYRPAQYLLGEFLHSKPLKKAAYDSWLSARGAVPREVSRVFRRAGFSLGSHLLKPGLAHQLKRYCRPMNCHRCEVFKKAINS